MNAKGGSCMCCHLTRFRLKIGAIEPLCYPEKVFCQVSQVVFYIAYCICRGALYKVFYSELYRAFHTVLCTVVSRVDL